MMEVGRITGGSFAWSRAQFGAWCVVSAPLILGLDLTDNATLASIIPFITNEVKQDAESFCCWRSVADRLTH